MMNEYTNHVIKKDVVLVRQGVKHQVIKPPSDNNNLQYAYAQLGLNLSIHLLISTLLYNDVIRVESGVANQEVIRIKKILDNN